MRLTNISPYAFPGIRVEDLLGDGEAEDNLGTTLLHNAIVDAIESVTKIKIKDFAGLNRDPDFVNARRMYCYEVRSRVLWSLKKIGQRMGNRDHTTVIHSIKKYHDEMKTNEIFRINATQVNDYIHKKLNNGRDRLG